MNSCRFPWPFTPALPQSCLQKSENSSGCWLRSCPFVFAQCSWNFMDMIDPSISATPSNSPRSAMLRNLLKTALSVPFFCPPLSSWLQSLHTFPWLRAKMSQVKSGLQVQQEKRPAMTSVVKDLEGITRATWLIRLLRLLRLPLFKITLET